MKTREELGQEILLECLRQTDRDSESPPRFVVALDGWIDDRLTLGNAEARIAELEAENARLKPLIIKGRDDRIVTQGAFNSCMCMIDTLEVDLGQAKRECDQAIELLKIAEAENAQLREAVRWRDAEKEPIPMDTLVLADGKNGLKVYNFRYKTFLGLYEITHWLPIPPYPTGQKER